MSTNLLEVQYIDYQVQRANQGVWGQMRRCALSQAGERVKYHDPDDTDKWEDGSSVNWDEYETNGWNCMVEIPKVYYRVQHGINQLGYEASRYEITGAPTEGFKLHGAFDRPNHKADFVYYSAFEAWVDSEGRMRSLPDKIVHFNETIDWFRESAKKNSHPAYILQDFLSYSLIQLLYITEYGDLNSQKMLGLGGAHKPTGQSLKNGNNSTLGSTTDYMSYRGIENLYGNKFKFVDGVNIDSGKFNVSRDYTKYSSKRVKPDSYEFVAQAPQTGLWVKEMHELSDENDLFFIPKAGGANSDTYYSDFYDYYYSSGHRVLLQGNFSKNLYSGVFSFYVGYSPSSYNSNTSSRLQCLK